MLSEEHARALAAVLDAIIPPDAARGMPGAGEVGVADHVASVLERSPELAWAVTAGLAALEPGFADLEPAARAPVLNALAASQPAFLPGLLFHAYQGYYQSPAVLEALGVPGRPPHPRGYEVEANDLSLLDPVRAMPRRYRDVPAGPSEPGARE